MNSSLREQIYKSLNLKETEELLEIWKTNDRVEWSETAFEVIEELLSERLGQVPPQDNPIFKHQDDSEEDDGLEEWEAKLLDDEDQPEFYDTLDVLSLRDNINKVAKVAIVVYAVIAILNIPVISMMIRNRPVNFWDALQFIPDALVILLNLGVRIAIIYFPLKALAHILRILMEMEFRSRKTG